MIERLRDWVGRIQPHPEERAAAPDLGSEGGTPPRERSDAEAVHYRGLARERGVRYAEASELLPEFDTAISSRFSAERREKHRVIPIAIQEATLVVASDDPGHAESKLRREYGIEEIEYVVVTPTAFARLQWVAELTLLEQAPTAEDALTHDVAHQPMSVALLETILMEAAPARLRRPSREPHRDDPGSDPSRRRPARDGALRDQQAPSLAHRAGGEGPGRSRHRRDATSARRAVRDHDRGPRVLRACPNPAYGARREHRDAPAPPRRGASVRREAGLLGARPSTLHALASQPRRTGTRGRPDWKWQDDDPLRGLREQARAAGLVSLRERALELVQAGTIAFDTLPRFIPLDRLLPPDASGRAR